MVQILEVISVFLLLDLTRRVHGARARFFHAQAYTAWMVFLACAIVSVVLEAATAHAAEDTTTLHDFATSCRIAAISALWAAMVVGLPGTLGRRALETTRHGCRGSETIIPVQPHELAIHTQSSPNGGTTT